MQAISSIAPTRPVPVPDAAAPAVAAAPPPASSALTQTQVAAQHMTPQTRAVVPDALLDAKIGRGTLAGALNDQIRFRVDRTGAPADWALLPDSPTAEAVVQSRAGADVLAQLRTAMGSTRTMAKVSNLKGFILARDNEAVLASTVLSSVDSKSSDSGKKLSRLGELGRTKTAGRVIRKDLPDLKHEMASAGAWNDDGWITFMPDTSRAMLTGAGAYAPDPTLEKNMREAKSWSDYISYVPSHEVQHSVSSPSPTAYHGTARWMEEGTANVLSQTPVFQAREARSAHVSAARYAGLLAHPAKIELGWKPWTRPTLPPAEDAKTHEEQDRNYGDSQVTLRDLVRLAGGDFRSKAGQERATELLQAKSMRYTPGVLADAIIQQHGLDPSVRERLRTRIAGAVDIEGGVAALAKEFGIT